MTSEVFSQASSRGAADPAGPTKKAPKRMRGSHVPRITLTGTLRLKAGGKELSMTAVTKAAKEALGKLKVGDRVRVFYTETEGKLLALPVEEAKVRLRFDSWRPKVGAAE